jgi:hypothetical protein
MIFQSNHSVPSNVSAEDYECVVNLVREYGQYPLEVGEHGIPDLTQHWSEVHAASIGRVLIQLGGSGHAMPPPITPNVRSPTPRALIAAWMNVSG